MEFVLEILLAISIVTLVGCLVVAILRDDARLQRETEARQREALAVKLAKAKADWDRGVRMTPAELREQRISFVYGQMMDCAPHMTKEEVAKIHDQTYGEDK